MGKGEPVSKQVWGGATIVASGVAPNRNVAERTSRQILGEQNTNHGNQERHRICKAAVLFVLEKKIEHGSMHCMPQAKPWFKLQYHVNDS